MVAHRSTRGGGACQLSQSTLPAWLATLSLRPSRTCSQSHHARTWPPPLLAIANQPARVKLAAQPTRRSAQRLALARSSSARRSSRATRATATEWSQVTDNAPLPARPTAVALLSLPFRRLVLTHPLRPTFPLVSPSADREPVHCLQLSNRHCRWRHRPVQQQHCPQSG